MPPPTEPKAVRRAAGTTAIALTLLAGWFAYLAVSWETTGTARYSRGRSSEIVTRETSPSRFREAINLSWGASGLCLAVAITCFIFYRKLNDHI